MSSKTQLYIWIALLCLIGIGQTIYKNTVLGFPFNPKAKDEVWVLEAQIDFEAIGEPIKASFSLPSYTSGYEVMDESVASPGYGYFRETKGTTSRAVWSAREKNGPQRLYYQISLIKTGEPLLIGQDKHNTDVAIPQLLEEPFLTAAQTVVEAAQALSADAETFTRDLLRRVNEENPTQNMLLLKGNAFRKIDTIDLIHDLLSRGNVPARIVNGLELEDGKRHAPLKRYIAIFDGQYWQLFNPQTAEMGYPQDLIIWGQQSILDVEGGEDSKIQLSMIKSSQSARVLALRGNDGSEVNESRLGMSIYTLPINVQAAFKLLLLIPIGALVVVVVRNLIGFSTSGTFMPILIAMAFIETRLITGLIMFLIVVSLGLLIRSYLSRLNLLLVPRIAAVVIVVVFLMIAISVFGHRLGLDEGTRVTLFPMIILAWTIERMSVLWDEQGAQEVYKQGGGSLFVAILIYIAMTNPWIQYYTFMFPELLLVVLAFILMIGTYSGYRLTELWRFQPLIED